MSELNPEAPEFFPNLTSVAQNGYTALSRTITSSRKMPSGVAFQNFMTFAGFSALTRHIGENVIDQSNFIYTAEVPTKSLKCFDNQSNIEKIVDANDAFLDRVNTHVDIESGVRPLETLSSLGPWQKTVQTAQLPEEFHSTAFLVAKNIPRPQLLFKDKIDNSANIWVPKITSKPHNIKPLALTLLYDDYGEPAGYEHVYQIELDLYNPPPELLEMGEEPPFPLSLEETPLSLVETEAQVDSLIEHLQTVDELAVDLEHHSYRSYQGITCLMQISTDTGGDFLVDTLALREHIHKFNEIFTNPKKLKVFHGAENDILWLQRDFGVYVVGMFDTHQAARALRLPGLSLKYILSSYCNHSVDKKFQLADWRIRPLPPVLMTYARSDTHFLLYVARRMRQELLTRHGGQTTLLESVFQQSKLICSLKYEKEVFNERSHLPVYERSKKSFNSRQMTAFKMLYKWRDEQARELDESPSYLIPNYMLLSLAEVLPRDLQGVEACCSPMPPFIKQNRNAVHRMLLTCRELPLEPQLFQMPASVSQMIQPALSYEVHDDAYLPDYSDEFEINLDYCMDLVMQPIEFYADIPVIEAEPVQEFVSTLNVDAKMFIPPYDRYRKFRTLAQIEEIKEYKEKEAKIAALSKGNDIIAAEIQKVQPKPQIVDLTTEETKTPSEQQNESPTLVEKMNTEHKNTKDGKTSPDLKKMTEEKKATEAKKGTVQKKGKVEKKAAGVKKIMQGKKTNEKTTETKTIEEKNTSEEKKFIEETNTIDQRNERKRKMSLEAADRKKLTVTSAITALHKSTIYKNTNYKKFYDDSKELRKQNKTKFKKHK